MVQEETIRDGTCRFGRLSPETGAACLKERWMALWMVNAMARQDYFDGHIDELQVVLGVSLEIPGIFV